VVAHPPGRKRGDVGVLLGEEVGGLPCFLDDREAAYREELVNVAAGLLGDVPRCLSEFAF
jgi:hypothetical protein